MLVTVSTKSKIALVVALSFAALSLIGADPIGLVFVALSLVLPLVALYFVVRWAVGAGFLDAGPRSTWPGRRYALEILDERYARGEIGREEFQRMRRDLEAA